MTNAELESLLASERIARVEAEREREMARAAYDKADGERMAHIRARQRMREALEEAVGWFVFYTTPGGRPRNPHGMLAVLRAALGAEPGDAALTQKGVCLGHLGPPNNTATPHVRDETCLGWKAEQKEGQGAPAAHTTDGYAGLCGDWNPNKYQGSPPLRCGRLPGHKPPHTAFLPDFSYECRHAVHWGGVEESYAAKAAPSPSNSSPIAADKGEGSREG